MKIFDLNEMTAAPYELRGRNVFYQANEFKTRIIELPPGGQLIGNFIQCPYFAKAY